MPGAPADSILTDNPHNGFQISTGDSMNLTGVISDLFDTFIVEMNSIKLNQLCTTKSILFQPCSMQLS